MTADRDIVARLEGPRLEAILERLEREFPDGTRDGFRRPEPDP